MTVNIWLVITSDSKRFNFAFIFKYSRFMNGIIIHLFKMSEKQRRTTLSLEVKKFIIFTKEKNPQMSYRQLAEKLLLKFDIKTSRSVICRTIKSKVEIMSLKMENDAARNENKCSIKRESSSKNFLIPIFAKIS